MLHIEMRINLIVLNETLVEGCSNCVKGSSHSETGGTGSARFNKHTNDIEELVNTQILGSIFNPSQWCFPVQKNVSPKKVGELKSDNRQTRKMLRNAMLIVIASVTDSERKEKNNQCLNNSTRALELLSEKTNFSDQEIKSFQSMIDLLFQHWVELWGEKSTSNCTHIYQPGHTSELLRYWKDLCKYSQQG